ncbi:hypothetical protein HY626_00605 [Candidatus Uhrbacteria bacterium]|nr:hypothetical protein [Candidatus Uhrbacteria bacterium]
MASVLLIGAFMAFRLGAWWFSRGVIFSLAPSDTILAIELHLNEKTKPFLTQWLAGIPLISERELELEDLSQYIHGDMAIFVTKNGERSVAVRTSKGELPNDLLTQYGISVQEQGGFILLSSALMPITGAPALTHRPFLPSIGEVWLGRVVFPDIESGGNLFVSEEEMTFDLHTSRKTSIESNIVENTSLSLADLTWGDEESSLDGLKRLSTNSLFLQKETHVNIVMRSGEQGLETLIEVLGSEPDSNTIIQELEKIGAFARPSLVTQTLPDGSRLEEILVQPDLVSVEEVSTSAGLSYRVPTGGGESIIATVHGGSILFSNSQELLESYAGATQDSSSTCSVLTNWLDPTFLLLQTQSEYLNPDLALISQIVDEFSAISFEVKKYSTIVHFCRT